MMLNQIGQGMFDILPVVRVALVAWTSLDVC
jgi:hypothetical protein